MKKAPNPHALQKALFKIMAHWSSHHGTVVKNLTIVAQLTVEAGFALQPSAVG